MTEQNAKQLLGRAPASLPYVRGPWKDRGDLPYRKHSADPPELSRRAIHCSIP